MTTVVLGTPPLELQALIEKRRSLGLDLFDECWDGIYHMSPAPNFAHAYVGACLTRILGPNSTAAGLVDSDPFNLGEPGNFRVPDHGYHRSVSRDVWVPTAVVVVEVVSPDDETYAKLGFYAAHGVDELIIADPAECLVRIYRRDGDHYDETGESSALAVTAEELTRRIDWP